MNKKMIFSYPIFSAALFASSNVLTIDFSIKALGIVPSF